MTLARDLLGRLLVRLERGKILAGRIIETEAYSGLEDKASHAYGGMKNRNAPMFGPPGTAYVYFTYGSCFCFNVVCGKTGHPDAVLIRAVEPLIGIEVMRRRRGSSDVKLLCSGPGRLCRAFGIDKRLNRATLTGNPALWIGRGRAVADAAVITSPRVGLSARTGEWRDKALRFVGQ